MAREKVDRFIETILASDDAVRSRSIESLTRNLTVEELLGHAKRLDRFRRTHENLYERVRGDLLSRDDSSLPTA